MVQCRCGLQGRGGWRSQSADMAWCSVVEWEQSCSPGCCNPTLFLDTCWSSEARQACEPWPIVFNPSPISIPSMRFELSSIKNKAKRQEAAWKFRRETGQGKPQSRLTIAGAELADPAAKKVRLPSSRYRGNWLDNVYFYFRKGWPGTPQVTRALTAEGSLTLPH